MLFGRSQGVVSECCIDKRGTCGHNPSDLCRYSLKSLPDFAEFHKAGIFDREELHDLSEFCAARLVRSIWQHFLRTACKYHRGMAALHWGQGAVVFLCNLRYRHFQVDRCNNLCLQVVSFHSIVPQADEEWNSVKSLQQR